MPSNFAEIAGMGVNNLGAAIQLEQLRRQREQEQAQALNAALAQFSGGVSSALNGVANIQDRQAQIAADKARLGLETQRAGDEHQRLVDAEKATGRQNDLDALNSASVAFAKLNQDYGAVKTPDIPKLSLGAGPDQLDSGLPAFKAPVLAVPALKGIAGGDPLTEKLSAPTSLVNPMLATSSPGATISDHSELKDVATQLDDVVNQAATQLPPKDLGDFATRQARQAAKDFAASHPNVSEDEAFNHIIAHSAQNQIDLHNASVAEAAAAKELGFKSNADARAQDAAAREADLSPIQKANLQKQGNLLDAEASAAYAKSHADKAAAAAALKAQTALVKPSQELSDLQDTIDSVQKLKDAKASAGALEKVPGAGKVEKVLDSNGVDLGLGGLRNVVQNKLDLTKASALHGTLGRVSDFDFNKLLPNMTTEANLDTLLQSLTELRDKKAAAEGIMANAYGVKNPNAPAASTPAAGPKLVQVTDGIVGHTIPESSLDEALSDGFDLVK